MAEVTVNRSRSIAAPVADVWATLADFDSISAWAPNVDHSCLLTEQAGDVGAVRRIQSGRVTVRETVTTWQRERQLSYSIVGLPAFVTSVINTWTLNDTGEGTEVTLTTEIIPGPRPPHRLASRVLSRAMTKTSDQMLDGLVAHLKVGAPS